MNTFPPSNSLHQESLPISPIMETKDKFDSFLKAALKEPTSKKVSKTKTDKNLKLLTDNTMEENCVMNKSACENREFILNKFFEGSFEYSKRNTEMKPIPKPRTKIPAKSLKSKSLSPPESHETFKVKTPKILTVAHQNVEALSLNSEKNKIVSDSISVASSGDTFRVKHAKILKTPDEIFTNQNKLISHKENSNNKIKTTDSSKDRGDILDTNVDKEDVISEMGSELSKSSKLNNAILDMQNETFSDKKPYDTVHLTIHKTDKLLLNSLVIHPVVKVHIVDIDTGNYYPKKYKERSVMYYYDDNLDYIPPIMTRPFNLQEQRSLIPAWEETILINEDFKYLFTENANLIIFFEILDFITLPALNEHTKGWHKIAFAFLKTGISNSINLGKVIRLQLYHNSTSKKDDSQRCAVWDKWHKKKLTKYPSTLYITINKIKSGEKKLTGLRSNDATQEEIGTENVENDNTQKINISPLVQIIEKKVERRNIDDVTTLPNKCIAQFETEEGCFTLKFSNNGLFLACALKIDKLYSIVIFSVVSFEEISHFPGHQGIIYSINWSPDDSLLTAASADGSVSVWDVLKMSFLQILPHSYFVYTSDVNQNFIVTGCYDAVVRLWKNESVVANFFLHQELREHEGYVTCVLFKNDPKCLLSSDSMGIILEWSLDSNIWSLNRNISIPDIKGTIINQIQLIGNDKRLIVHSRDSIIRIVDMNTTIVINWLHGGINRRFHTSFSLTPCGHFLVAGSENSLINIWNVKTGKYVGNLIPFDSKSFITIHGLSFHPKDNILAVSHFGSTMPILLFRYDDENNMKKYKSTKIKQ